MKSTPRWRANIGLGQNVSYVLFVGRKNGVLSRAAKAVLRSSKRFNAVKKMEHFSGSQKHLQLMFVKCDVYVSLDL